MSGPVYFHNFQSITQIGRINFLKSPLFDRKFHFSHLLQYKNVDRHVPEVGACAVKTGDKNCGELAILYSLIFDVTETKKHTQVIARVSIT